MSPSLLSDLEPPATPTTAARLQWYAQVARRAPSKHNTQPWRFVLDGTSLELWGDPARLLPETDPHRRELVISCGAAVHLACVAMRAIGVQPWVHLLPEGRGGPLARVVEAGGWRTSPDDTALLAAVGTRRTDRGPLDEAALPAELPFLLQRVASEQGATLRLVRSPGERAGLAELVSRADRLLVRRGKLDAELARWLREPAQPHDDGVPADHGRGAKASYRAELVQRDFSLPGVVSAQDRPGRDAPLLAVLCSAADEQRDWLVTGAALAAVLLQATAAGGSASYLNQPVEESAIRVQLQEQLRLPGPPQLVLRIGRGGPVEPTARRSLDEVAFRASPST